jgi:hypothetical protein
MAWRHSRAGLALFACYGLPPAASFRAIIAPLVWPGALNAAGRVRRGNDLMTARTQHARPRADIEAGLDAHDQGQAYQSARASFFRAPTRFGRRFGSTRHALVSLMLKSEISPGATRLVDPKAHAAKDSRRRME